MGYIGLRSSVSFSINCISYISTVGRGTVKIIGSMPNCAVQKGLMYVEDE